MTNPNIAHPAISALAIPPSSSAPPQQKVSDVACGKSKKDA